MVDVDGGYLKPHGTRRGTGEAIYRQRGAAAAQRALQHPGSRTTSQMYAHIEASELAEDVGEVFESESAGMARDPSLVDDEVPERYR